MDQKEFVKIIKEYQGLINNVCYLYFRTSEDIKDARQEIILQLWRSYSNFDHRSKLSTWIYRLALNTTLNLVRKDSSLKAKKESLTLNAPSPIFHSHDDDVQYLKHLIGCLKEMDKAVILLYLEGYSNKEISCILGLTMTNVSTRLYRVKQYLRKLHNTKFYESK